MSGKLDQSLDDILKTRRTSTRRGNKGRRSTNKPAATQAPVGGVKKATKQAPQQQAKAKAKAAPPTGPSGHGESKIIVSNLPTDVDEKQIKEYFNKGANVVKKAMLTYGPDGLSRGVCTVIFKTPEAGAEAAKKLDGVKVDNRLMRVELVMSAKDAPPPQPAKKLADRVVQPKQAKAQPKPATTTKGATKGTTTRGRGNKRGRGGRATRAPKKTAEELDAEMVDYFDGGVGDSDAMVTNGGAVQAPAAGDTGMDEML